MIKKIAVIGPESTGKSSLCASLARHYQTIWCPEYARTYLLKNGTSYTYENLLSIAEGQLKAEDVVVQQEQMTYKERSFVFIDTNMYVMKVWCEYVFGKCHQYILDQIATRKYDFYLLCNTDLPWEKDDLREYPDEATRKELFTIYKDILLNQTVPWKEIGGLNEERLSTAITIINEHFGEPLS